MAVYQSNKYELLIKQQSTDGINWTNVVPIETAVGALIEVNSPDCQYQPQYTYLLATGTSTPVLVEAFSNGLQTRLTGKAVLDGKEMSIEQADEALGSSAVTAYFNSESTRLNGFTPVTTITPGVTATTGNVVTGTASATTGETSFTTDYSSYYLQQKWIRYPAMGNDVWLPAYPRQTRKSPYKRMDEDPECGFVPPETIYFRWVQSGYTCITESVTAETQYRWADTSEYVCSGNTKYRLQIYQASEDSGATWYNVSPNQYQRGSVLENPSSDCAMNVKTLVQIPSTSTTYTLADNHYGALQSAWADSVQPLDIGSNTVRYKFARTGMHSVDYLMQSTLLQPEMFKNNQRLREVQVPANISQIGMCAFSGCSYLSAVTLENVDAIDTSAFAKCTRLTSITLPPSLSIIGDLAFSGCSALTTVYLTCDLPPTLGEDVFDGCTNLRHIYVSDVLYTTIIYSPEWEPYVSLISVGEP